MSNISPVPAVPLRDDPTQDSVWKRWLQQLTVASNTFGPGTVTSVGLSLPSILTVTNSPVIASGTLTGTLAVQNANKVWSGPTTGADAAPTFRALVSADIPLIPISTGVSGLGTNVATLLGTFSSANLAAALTTKTGTGNAVFAESSPVFGAPAIQWWDGVPTTPMYVFVGDGTAADINICRFNGGGTGGAAFIGDVSRAASYSTSVHGAVQSGDALVSLMGGGDDGTSFRTQAGRIINHVDGTVSNGVIPGKWDFYTADSSGVMTLAATIDSSQRTILGAAAAFDTSPAGTGQYPKLGMWVDSSGVISQALGKFSADANGGNFLLLKSRSSTIGTNTVVQNGDQVGAILARAADGTNYINAASIQISVDGVPATNVMPGKIVFNINTGGDVVVEAMRINATKAVTCATTINTGSYTVATLPAGVTGARAYVTDALGPAFLAAVVGGGAVTCPVFYSASAAAWVCG